MADSGEGKIGFFSRCFPSKYARFCENIGGDGGDNGVDFSAIRHGISDQLPEKSSSLVLTNGLSLATLPAVSKISPLLTLLRLLPELNLYGQARQEKDEKIQHKASKTLRKCQRCQQTDRI